MVQLNIFFYILLTSHLPVRHRRWSQTTSVRILALLLTSCVIWARYLVSLSLGFLPRGKLIAHALGNN